MRVDGGWRRYGVWTAGALGAQALLALFGLAFALRLLPAADHLVWISGVAAAGLLTLLDLGYPQRVQRALQLAVSGSAVGDALHPLDASWARAPRAGLAWVAIRLIVCATIVACCLAWPGRPRSADAAGTAAALTGLNAARGGYGLVTAALFAEQRFVAERQMRLAFITIQIVALPIALVATRSALTAAAIWAGVAATAAVGTILTTAPLRTDLMTLRLRRLPGIVLDDVGRGRHEIAEWLGVNVPIVALVSLALPVAVAVLSPGAAAQFAIVAAGYMNVLGLSREVFDGARADNARRWFNREPGVARRAATTAIVAAAASALALGVLLFINVAVSRVVPPSPELVAAYLALVAIEAVQLQITLTTVATGYVRFGVVTTLAAIVYGLVVVPAAKAFGAPGIPLSLMAVQTFFVYQYNIRKGLRHLDYR